MTGIREMPRGESPPGLGHLYANGTSRCTHPLMGHRWSTTDDVVRPSWDNKTRSPHKLTEYADKGYRTFAFPVGSTTRNEDARQRFP